MSPSSVNTNVGAYIALQSLVSTNAGLAAAQKQVSTGYRVADASDDGASFAVAQKVRSAVSGLTAVNQQLGNMQGLLSVAQTSLTTISNIYVEAKSLLVGIANDSTSSDQRGQYVTQYEGLLSQVANALDNSFYNGQSLLGSADDPYPPGSSFSVVVNETGTEISFENQSKVPYYVLLPENLSYFINENTQRFVDPATGAATDYFFASGSAPSAQATAQVALTPSDPSSTVYNDSFAPIADALNNVASFRAIVDAAITLNTNKIDALNAGLGSLIDADLTRESAVLQSLQIKQQLGTQALSIANQSPQSLLSLFK